MWAQGEIASPELWLFAYEDGGGNHLPLAEEGADLVVNLNDEVWARKKAVLTNVYGLEEESWEVRSTPRREAFWRLRSPEDALHCLEKGKPVK
jgi:hypothetical protein